MTATYVMKRTAIEIFTVEANNDADAYLKAHAGDFDEFPLSDHTELAILAEGHDYCDCDGIVVDGPEPSDQDPPLDAGDDAPDEDPMTDPSVPPPQDDGR